MHKTLLTLASLPTLSYFESAFRGFHIRQCHSLEALKSVLRRPGEVFVLAEFPKCTLRHVEAFLALRSEKPDLRLIIYSQSIDWTAHQQFSRNSAVLLLNKTEKDKVAQLSAKFIQGQPIFSRHSERLVADSPVLVKCTQWVPTSVNLPQRKGRFMDFAKLGAKLYLPQRSFHVKDYISVLYQSQNQEWITVECQLRWEMPTADGGQICGVQFLAIA